MFSHWFLNTHSTQGYPVNFAEPVPEASKKEKKKSAEPEMRPVPPSPPAEPAPVAKDVIVEDLGEEGELVLDPVPVRPVDPPDYSIWEKMSPPARRKKQIANMESGSREVLALVRSIRENMDHQVLAQKALLKSLEHLPEAVDSVKQLSEYTGQHAEMLTLMHEQMESGLENHRNMNESVNRFNETLVSMDKTTQLLLERAQRSEQQLHKMLRRSQRRLLAMMLLMILMFGGGLFVLVYVAFPEHSEAWLTERNLPTLTSLRARAPRLDAEGEAAPALEVEPALEEPAVLERVEEILEDLNGAEDQQVPTDLVEEIPAPTADETLETPPGEMPAEQSTPDVIEEALEEIAQ